MRRALVVALHDGFYSAATGAGLSNQALLAAAADHLPPDTALVVAPVRIDPASPQYDDAAHSRTLAILERVPHEVLPLDNGTNGQTRFGDLAAFRHLSGHAATVLRSVTERYDGGALLATDRPFVGVGPRLALPPDWRAVYLPRSTALHHDDPDHQAWERAGLRGWLDAGAGVGAISTHMREVLVEAGVPAECILDVPDGLTGEPVPLTAAPDLPAEAAGGYLLAFGRAEPYKGFDDLVDAMQLLGDDTVPVPHLLLAAVTDGDRLTPYQEHLAHRCAGRPVTLWTRFDPGIPGLLHHPAVRSVIVPSRIEPFGRIPLEAFLAGAGPVVATATGGLMDTVIDGATGYLATPGDPRSLASAIKRALTADAATRSSLRDVGRCLAADRDYTRTVRSLVDELFASQSSSSDLEQFGARLAQTGAD